MNRVYCCSLTFQKLVLNFSQVPHKPHDSAQETQEMRRSWAIFGIGKNSLHVLGMHFLYRSYLMIPKISSHTPPQYLEGQRKRKVKWHSITWYIRSITETDFSPQILFLVSTVHTQLSLSLGAFFVPATPIRLWGQLSLWVRLSCLQYKITEILQYFLSSEWLHVQRQCYWVELELYISDPFGKVWIWIPGLRTSLTLPGSLDIEIIKH